MPSERKNPKQKTGGAGSRQKAGSPSYVERVGGLTDLTPIISYEPPEDRTIRDLLAVRPPATPLGVAITAGVQALETKYKDKGDEAEEKILDDGHANTVEIVVGRLNRSGLSDTVRLLLSTRDVLGHLILFALDPEGDSVRRGDAQGLYQSILRNVEKEPLDVFESTVLNDVFTRNKLAPTKKQKERIRARVHDAGLPLAPNQAEELILEIHREVAREGELPELIAGFATRKNIPDALLTREVVVAMVDYLLRLGIPITREKANRGEFDEFFTLAYEEATGITDSKRDPIVLAGQPGKVTPWNFEVDRFETADVQGVVRENILAAGALDYLYYLGDVMNVYGLADALVLRWASGLLDIVSTDTSNQLYRYWKLRERRITPEERAMLYKRVLNKGETELLSKMVVNEAFPRLWHNLMERMAEYIEDTEEAARDTLVSKVPVIRAAQDVAFNQTDNATGMVHMQVTEMYAQFEDAFEVLNAPEIVAQLSGGRRKTVWAVIDRLSREDFGTAIDVATIRTLAVEGNKVFEWVAKLEPGNVVESEFQDAIQAGEKWIIAAASMPDVTGSAVREDEEEEEDEFQEEFAGDQDTAW